MFLVVVLAHWAEHTGQIQVLGWPVPDSRGVVGSWFPWPVHVFPRVELHQFHAVMLCRWRPAPVLAGA